MGFVLAALRMRLDGITGPLWKPVDWILATEKRSERAIDTIVGAVIVYLSRSAGLGVVILAIPGSPILSHELH